MLKLLLLIVFSAGSGQNTAGLLNPGSGLTGTNEANLQQALAGNLIQNYCLTPNVSQIEQL